MSISFQFSEGHQIEIQQYFIFLKGRFTFSKGSFNFLNWVASLSSRELFKHTAPFPVSGHGNRPKFSHHIRIQIKVHLD